MSGARRQAARPSIWPVTLALGISLACAGILTHWSILVAGAAVTIVALAAWARDAIGGDG
jgi:hypothetical protein